MKEYQCKCGASNKIKLEHKGTATGLYCTECGRWIKWVNKDEQKVVEHIIQQKDKASGLPDEIVINGVIYVRKVSNEEAKFILAEKYSVEVDE